MHATDLSQIGTLRHGMDLLHCFSDTLQELRKNKHSVSTYSNRPIWFLSAGVYCSEIASQLRAHEVRKSITINITVKKKIFTYNSIHIDNLTKNFEHEPLSTEHQHWNPNIQPTCRLSVPE
jgi:hypothetical protein